MLRMLLGALVVAHGFVTAVIWSVPPAENVPFDVTHSWLAGDSRSAAMTMALLAGAGFVVTGAGFLAHQRWWGACGIASGTLAAALMLVYFSPWLIAGLAISAGVAYAGARAVHQARPG